MRKKGVHILLLLMICFGGISQTTLYSEDFENATYDNKGQNGATFDVSGVTNWSVDMTGSSTMSGSDRFMQMPAGYFESFNTDAPSTDPVDWFSSSVNISGYTNVTVSLDLSRNNSSSTSGTEAFYRIDGGAWVSFGSQIGSAANNSPSVSGLSGSTIEIRVAHWGNSSTPSYRHDNVSIVGTAPPCGANTAPTNLAIVSDETSIDISWDDPTTGDAVIVVIRETVNGQASPVDFTAYSGNTDYSLATEIGSSQNYIVYSGDLNTNSITVTNLLPDRSYTVDVYSSVSASPCYYGTPVTVVQSTLRSTNYYVNNSTFDGDDTYTTVVGNNSNAGYLPNLPKLSLTNLLSTYSGSFVAGDTIFIDAGTFNDIDLTFSDAGVTIIGQGMQKTIFDNPGADNYFMTFTGNDNTISNLRIFSYNENGTSKGKALDLNGVTGMTVTNVQFDSNNESGGGYAIEIYNNASVTFNGGGTTCNNFTGSGGARIKGATSNVVFNEFQFVANARSEAGPSLKIENGTVTIKTSRFSGNMGTSDLKGVAIYILAGTTTITDCIFDDNDYIVANNYIGGAISIAGGTVDIKRSIIKNTTSISGSGVYGSGIGVTGGTVSIDSCLFIGNAGERANDVYIDGGTVTAFNTTFSSSGAQLGQVSGSFTIEQCGSPSEYTGSSITKTNTTTPSYTANPNVPVNYTGDCTAGIILPIKLSYFKGECTKNGIKLFWETASEINNDYFTIEHSLDLETFDEVATIAAAGNSNSYIQYTASHEYANSGINYYRLKQTDFNGRFSTSNTIAIKNNCNMEEIIHNIFLSQNNLKVEYFTDHDKHFTIELYDIQGKLIVTENNLFNSANRNISLPISTMAKGIYIVRIYDESYTFTQKVNN